ncbi:MAG: zf-HC2 domain-containing protein [Candidatus Aminicenantes bacterium]|nr:zf-HC2 domain-containing protein [Candidatus Aminicenantes bacterium]
MNSCRFRQAIDDYLLQRLGEEEKAGFEEHFFNCRDCFEELKAREEILRVIKARGGEIFTGGAEPAGEAIEPGRRAALRFKPWWGMAALAAAAALVLILYLPRRQAPSPVFTLGQDEIVRGETLVLLSPAGPVGPAGILFEWQPLSRKARYALFLYEGELLWSVETDDTRLELPEEWRQRLMPGRTYSWEVKAYSPPGTLITASAKAEFRIRED